MHIARVHEKTFWWKAYSYLSGHALSCAIYFYKNIGRCLIFAKLYFKFVIIIRYVSDIYIYIRLLGLLKKNNTSVKLLMICLYYYFVLM